MKLANTHISYCTNIHPGQDWHSHFDQLRTHVPAIKDAVSPDAPFGLGLRISAEASEELLKPECLLEFQLWLKRNDIYVFTLNGFPYGDFHEKRVKDMVHFPDWTSKKRKDYTISLFKILAELMPEKGETGISTSPLSYRFWFDESAEEWRTMREEATLQIVEVASFLYQKEISTGKYMHLDIEPEPDGVLENVDEFIAWYQQELLPAARAYFERVQGLDAEQSKHIINRYITICYDVCHFALAYEQHPQAMKRLEELGINIGKFQISSALKVQFTNDVADRLHKQKVLEEFDEPIYLHQVIARDKKNNLVKYRDLMDALQHIENLDHVEWRSHFHVPIFLDQYGEVSSTQQDILEVLALHKEQERTRHLEVETYTWGVLPPSLQIPIQDSIARELQWLLDELKD